MTKKEKAKMRKAIIDSIEHWKRAKLVNGSIGYYDNGRFCNGENCPLCINYYYEYKGYDYCCFACPLWMMGGKNYCNEEGSVWKMVQYAGKNKTRMINALKRALKKLDDGTLGVRE